MEANVTRFITDKEAIDMIAKGTTKGYWRYTAQLLAASTGIAVVSLGILAAIGLGMNAFGVNSDDSEKK